MPSTNGHGQNNELERVALPIGAIRFDDVEVREQQHRFQ